jgi:hypothetical protein
MLKQLPSATSSTSQGSSSSSDSKLAAVLSNEVCAQLFGMGAVAFKQVSISQQAQLSDHSIQLLPDVNNDIHSAVAVAAVIYNAQWCF